MKIIGLAGRAGTGKTTLARAMSKLLSAQERNNSCVRSFADPIKVMSNNLWQFLGHEGAPNKTDLMYKNVSVRKVMQTLGTEWGREHLGPDIWVDCMRVRAERARKNGVTHFIIDDVRFPNEVEMIQSLDGTVVALARNGYEPEASRHASEDFYAVVHMPRVVPWILHLTPEEDAKALLEVCR